MKNTKNIRYHTIIYNKTKSKKKAAYRNYPVSSVKLFVDKPLGEFLKVFKRKPF
ncbi:MAG: hypothetical protein V4642_15895 [Bacteroidota bacterium]